MKWKESIDTVQFEGWGEKNEKSEQTTTERERGRKKILKRFKFKKKDLSSTNSKPEKYKEIYTQTKYNKSVKKKEKILNHIKGIPIGLIADWLIIRSRRN